MCCNLRFNQRSYVTDRWLHSLPSPEETTEVESSLALHREDQRPGVGPEGSERLQCDGATQMDVI